MADEVCILLIENDSLDAKSVQRAFSQLKPAIFSVEHEKSLAAGLERLSATPFHAVLLDLRLPDSEGVEAIEQVDALVPNVPIIVLTSMHDEALEMRAIESGAQDFLSKDSVDARKLVRTLKHAAKRKQQALALHNHANAPGGDSMQELVGVINETSKLTLSKTKDLKETGLNREQVALVEEIETKSAESIKAVTKYANTGTPKRHFTDPAINTDSTQSR